MAFSQYKRVTLDDIKNGQPKPKIITIDPTGKNSGGWTDIRFLQHMKYGKVIQFKHGDKWYYDHFYRWSETYHSGWGWYEPLKVYICNTSIG